MAKPAVPRKVRQVTTKPTRRPKKEPTPGQKVVLTALPRGFINDLPVEDQRAISGAVGKPVVLNA